MHSAVFEESTGIPPLSIVLFLPPPPLLPPSLSPVSSLYMYWYIYIYNSYIYIYTYEGRSKLLILLQQKMDVIGFELDLIVLQCFEFVAYL